MFLRWLSAFALTQLVEVPIYRRAFRGRILASFGASALTHPVVWWALVPLWERAYLRWLAPSEALRIASPWARFALLALFVETFAVLVEALYLRALGLARPWRWSLLANGASFTTGLLLHALRSLLERGPTP